MKIRLNGRSSLLASLTKGPEHHQEVRNGDPSIAIQILGASLRFWREAGPEPRLAV